VRSDLRVADTGDGPASTNARDASATAGNRPSLERWYSRRRVAVGVPLAVGLVHVALVAPHYFVGSFDDDASYVLTAKALLAGQGLTGHVASGAVVVGLYPPGYSALIAPLVWLWPHSFLPLRLFSAACYAALFPLTWAYLRRRGVGELKRVAALGVLALGPPLATFGSMVMAEAPFLDVLLVLLILVDVWDRQDMAWTWAGAGAVAGAAALLWLKQAGLGIALGLLLWTAFHGRRPVRIRRTLFLLAGLAASAAPVVAARLAAGLPLAGSRYAQELGAYYQGSLADRLVHVFPQSLLHLLTTALPATLVPYFSPLPIGWQPVWDVLSWAVAALVLVGASIWVRRHRDASAAAVGIYLLETVFWPYVNERRTILVVPLLAVWLVLGAAWCWNAALALWRRHSAAGRGAHLLGLLVVFSTFVAPLLVQAPRDYLYALGQDGSRFEGSRYSGLLSHIGVPSDVVETDYLSSTALFTGHRTARTAFDASLYLCYEPGIITALSADHAAFLLLGDVNKPGLLDSPCLDQVASTSSWAVRLLHTSRDDATVFELVGRGTGNPDSTDLVRNAARSVRVSGPVTTYEWDWSTGRSVRQITVGEAAAVGAPTASVTLEIRSAGGDWVVADRSARPVGDGGSPYLLDSLGAQDRIDAFRVVVSSDAGSQPAVVADVHAIGAGP
jgi:hypothetical protein